MSECSSDQLTFLLQIFMLQPVAGLSLSSQPTKYAFHVLCKLAKPRRVRRRLQQASAASSSRSRQLQWVTELLNGGLLLAISSWLEVGMLMR